MDTATVIDLGRQALWTIALVSAPLLLVALAVGLFIGIIQAAIRGEFNAWAGQDKSKIGDVDPPTAPRTANPEMVHTHLAQLHALLHPK